VCPGCGEWELHTGTFAQPVAGLPGTPPDFVQLHAPIWRQKQPAQSRQGKGAGGGRDQAGAGPAEGTGKKKVKVGKRPLETSNPLKFQVYQRIQQEHQPGNEYLDTVDRLKADKQFAEQVKEAGLKLDTRLVRAALAFFDQRERAQAGKNQETDPA
jgi:hypothetical protein